MVGTRKTSSGVHTVTLGDSQRSIGDEFEEDVTDAIDRSSVSFSLRYFYVLIT